MNQTKNASSRSSYRFLLFAIVFLIAHSRSFAFQSRLRLLRTPQISISQLHVINEVRHLGTLDMKGACGKNKAEKIVPETKSGIAKTALRNLLPYLVMLLVLARTPSRVWASSIITGNPQTMVTPTVVATHVTTSLENQLSLRLAVAALIGAILGKERSLAKHSAGVRTMALVAMGAAAYTICSAYGFLQYSGRYDPSRMAANVASGVGFIGAGVITHSGASTSRADKPDRPSSSSVVHGLTTAATIWLSAAVGVACGVGLFRVATTAAFSTIAILRLGRMTPKVQQNVQDEVGNTRQQVSNPGRTAIRFSNSTIDLEEHDAYAELHDTRVWDEEVREDEDEVETKGTKIATNSTKSPPFELFDENSSNIAAIIQDTWKRDPSKSHLPNTSLELQSMEDYQRKAFSKKKSASSDSHRI